MSELSPLTWVVGISALVVGILAGHHGWGRRFTRRFTKFDPDYLVGLDYLVSEQPDRALDTFLKLMDTNADTLETHFALGSLYRRRGEVERAIRVHQNLLARTALAPEHREQALHALAYDYLRAGLLDRAEELFRQVTQFGRLRSHALEALRGIYEGQGEWRPALEVYRELARLGDAPPRFVAAHYLCELAQAAISRDEIGPARQLLREARREVPRFPRAAVLRSRIAAHQGDSVLALALLRSALQDAPRLLPDELPHLLGMVPDAERGVLLGELAATAAAADPGALRRLVLAAVAAGIDATDEGAPGGGAPGVLQLCLEKVLAGDPIWGAVWGADGGLEGGRPPAAGPTFCGGNARIAGGGGQVPVYRMWLFRPDFLLALPSVSRLGKFRGVRYR